VDVNASSIDMNTVLKVSLELAQETSLESLMRKLTAILIHNAGAQNGMLFLRREEGWFLEVEGSADLNQDFALLSIPLEEQATQVGGAQVPISIIHEVINSQTDLLLEDVSTSQLFNNDPYVQSRKPKSILCTPLLNQGELIGVAYLENTLAVGAFTSDTQKIVKLISGQAAVLIEKSRLYENMERLIEDRTRELSETNRKLDEQIYECIRIEKSLRLSEERYRTVFESTGTAMAVIDEDGCIVLTNEKFVQLTGYAKDVLENHFDPLKLVASTDLVKFRHLQNMRRKDPAQVPGSFKFRLVDRWGGKKDVLVTVTLLQGSNSFIMSLNDISQRNAVDAALRYNEALLRKILEILPVGVWVIDKTSKVILGNPEAYRIWGGAKFVDMQQYGEYKAWRVKTGELIKAEEWAAGLAITHGQIILNEELEIEAFDGSHRIILNSAKPIVLEEDGLIGAVVVNQDITRRKQIEDEIQKAHDQLASMLQISQSIVSILDLDRLLEIIVEQLQKVIPYEAVAILTRQQNFMEFEVVHGPSVFQSLAKQKIPIVPQIFLDTVLREQDTFYIPDLQAEDVLLTRIQDLLKIPADQLIAFRSCLGLPLIVKDDLIGFLVLAHPQRDYYSPQFRIMSKTYANQIAIALQNAQFYKRAYTVAALEERNRLAREMHDSVAQTLYSISLFTDATRLALETNKLDVVKNHLEELVELSREAMSDMRLLIYEMRSPVLEKNGLAAALQSRLDAVESRAGFKTIFSADGELNLTSQEESELYRIAQEALNNVIKHARADQVRVELTRKAECVRLTIEDDGVGCDLTVVDHGGGQGFQNIRERAENIGARYLLESAPGQGTKVTIEVNR
jgi:PAS domain S-box-containing protein